MQSISVIIPTYNRDKYIKRAVESVVHQKHFKGEIIIIDDGSSDNTAQKVKELQNKYPLVYSYTENKGPAGARNLGIKLANFQLIAFLDSDDHWQKNKLTKQLSLMKQNPAYNISHTGEKWLRRGEHLNQKNIHKPRQGDIFDHCLQLCCVGMSTVIVKKELLEETGGFDATLPCCEDYDLWLRISRKHHFLLLPEPLTTKEGGREDQVSFQHRVGMDKYRIFAIQKLLNEHDLNDIQKKMALNMLRKKCKVYGTGCIKHGRVEEGNHYLALPEKYKIYHNND